MTVLDAYAVIAYLRDEPCAEEVATLLRSPSFLSAANAAEVLDQLARVYLREADDVHADLELLSYEGMEIVPVTADIGLQAGRLRARHYDREGSAVSLADCIAAATALLGQRALATADAALASVVRAEGGQVHGLVDSTGRKP